MKMVMLAFSGWWSLLSHLSPKISVELPRAAREQDLNPSKLLLLFLSHSKDDIGHYWTMMRLKAMRMLSPRQLQNDFVGLGQLLIRQFFRAGPHQEEVRAEQEGWDGLAAVCLPSGMGLGRHCEDTCS